MAQWRLRGIAGSACGLVLALAAGASADPVLTARGPGTVAFTAHGIHESQPAKRIAAYRRLRMAGVRAIRLDVTWADVERPDGGFDFSEPDREIALIRRAGLRVIALLGYGHPRHSAAGGALAATPASGGVPPLGLGSARHFPPDDPEPFARFAQAAARHLGPEVMAWEVWNEQNVGWRFWLPREDPAAYARLLCATRTAIRRVERTPVVFGGVFVTAVSDQPHMSGPEFVERAYRAIPRLGRCFDALAYHPYPYPFTAPELDAPVRGSVLAAAEAMRAVLRRHRDGRTPLWITEIGWPTHERAYGVDEAKQAQYVARMQAASFAQGIEVLNWYTYGDGADPSGANQEAHFGFFRADGSPKPAYRALSTSWRMLGWSRFVADRSGALGLPTGGSLQGGRAFALEFRRRTRRVVAVWIAPEAPASDQGGLPDEAPRETVSVPITARAGAVDVFDHLGRRRRVRPQRGLVWVAAGPELRYVVERLRPAAGSSASRAAVASRQAATFRSLMSS